MAKRVVWVVALAATVVGAVHVRSAEAVPAFARQYDVQCNVCHTRPPRLNSFGEQFHLMGFQMPSAARPDGLVGVFREDGAVKAIIDSLAVRVVGGLFEYSTSPRETERKFEPPHEVEIFITRAVTPDLTFYAELEYEPKALSFSRERGFFEESHKFGLGKEAFFMLNLGRALGAAGAPTMEMGGMTMVGRHGGFNMHGPMLMAGKIDPSTNFSYPTNRQLILDTETEIEIEPGHERAEIHRFAIVPYAFASKFFGLFKDRDGEPQLVVDQVMYNTTGSPGADFHAMFMNNLFLGQAGFLRENEGFSAYGMFRMDFGERRGFQFNASALVNWGFGVARAPDPHDTHDPGDRKVDRLRYGIAANARWKQLDIYGAMIWDRIYNLPGELKRQFDRTAAGLTIQADYLAHEKLMLSTRFDQLWAGGLKDDKRDASVFTLQARYYPWPNIAFFVRDSVNLRGFEEKNPLRSWRNQFFAGVDWDF